MSFLAKVLTRKGEIKEVWLETYLPTLRLWEPTGEWTVGAYWSGVDAPGIKIRTYESRIFSDGSVIYTERDGV